MMVTESKTDLLRKKAEHEKELEKIEEQLFHINNMEKPFVANVVAYSGHYSMQFKTEDQARKKYQEYKGKKYFKNGLNYGVYLYQYNPDGTKTLMMEEKLTNYPFDASKMI